VCIFKFSHESRLEIVCTRYLLVTRNGQLVGVLKKKDILEHIEMYRKGIHRRDEDDIF
jgi:signal-transduction protein with cAMP-binding, CBS, and nucleotidyltransferase domain